MKAIFDLCAALKHRAHWQTELSALQRLLDLGPRVAERNRAVEDQRAGRGIKIRAEITHPFELAHKRNKRVASKKRRKGMLPFLP